MKICRVVTVPMTFATLLREQISYINAKGIKLTLVSSPGKEFDDIQKSTGIPCKRIPFARKPAPLRDFYALCLLTLHFICRRYTIVHSSTPKAGFLCAIAACISRIPVRMHTFTGQVWAEKKGAQRWLLRMCDVMIGCLCSHLYADSRSQREFLVAEKIVAPGKILVLGAGSISGVNLEKYNPDINAVYRARIRHDLNIAAHASVILFIGRIRRDKGIGELVQAFECIREKHSDVYLVLAGPSELDQDPVPAAIFHRMNELPGVFSIGFAAHPEQYLAAADIFCLPSYREGFGSVVIEAGAMGLPVVATRVPGLVDAVIDGVTGILVEKKNVRELASALVTLLESPQLRAKFGTAARARAGKEFGAELINDLVVQEYLKYRK